MQSDVWSRIAIIGGTGIDEMPGFRSGRSVVVRTRFGEALVESAEINGVAVTFVPRHGADHSVPPSAINYRAQIAGLRKLGIERVIGICAVGALRESFTPGSFAVLRDFIDLTKRRADTFYDQADGVVHTDFTEPYCPIVSNALGEGCASEGVDWAGNAVYVGVEGPRYESPAEVRLYRSWGGDVVGMTNLPEAVLAREAGLCYGCLAIVANYASGLSATPLNHDEVRAACMGASERLAGVVGRAASSLESVDGHCCSAGRGLDI